MLLRDCPVGSEVRLVSFCGFTDYGIDHWEGTFVVFEHDGVNCVQDRDGYLRDDISDNANYQFEIVSQSITERKKIEIDGVVYEMEAV